MEEQMEAGKFFLGVASKLSNIERDGFGFVQSGGFSSWQELNRIWRTLRGFLWTPKKPWGERINSRHNAKQRNVFVPLDQ